MTSIAKSNIRRSREHNKKICHTPPSHLHLHFHICLTTFPNITVPTPSILTLLISILCLLPSHPFLSIHSHKSTLPPSFITYLHALFCLNHSPSRILLMSNHLLQITRFRQLPLLIFHPYHRPFPITLLVPLSGRVMTKSPNRHHSSTDENTAPCREPLPDRITPFLHRASDDKITESSPLATISQSKIDERMMSKPLFAFITMIIVWRRIDGMYGHGRFY